MSVQCVVWVCGVCPCRACVHSVCSYMSGVCTCGGCVPACVVRVLAQVVHVCVLCMGGGTGNRQTDREFLRMINGLWKEAPRPSDAPGPFCAWQPACLRAEPAQVRLCSQPSGPGPASRSQRGQRAPFRAAFGLACPRPFLPCPSYEAWTTWAAARTAAPQIPHHTCNKCRVQGGPHR